MEEDKNQDPAGSSDDGGSVVERNPFEMVQEIEKILAGEPMERAEGEEGIEFPLTDALELIPHRYLKEVDPEDVYGETVLVSPDDLYGQLARGKVEVSLSKLAYYIPLHLIYHAALNEETSVVLPLKKVVRAIGLEELKSRTPDNFRLYDISVFDDPFKEGEATLSADAGLVFDEEPEEEAGGGLVFEEEPAEPESTAEVSTPVIEPESEEEAAEPAQADHEEAAAPETPLPVEPFLGAEESVPVEEEKEPAVTEAIDESVAALAPEKPAGKISDSINFPVVSLVESCPEIFSGSESEGAVTLNVANISAQLRRGVVTISLTSIAEALPEGAVKDGASIDPDTTVTLDLKQTVNAVGIDALIAATPPTIREYDISWMADPFEEPDEKPDLEAVRISKKAKKKADAEAPAPEPLADSQMSPKITVYKPAADGDSELDYYELPGNININSASSDELMLLKGVGRHLADAIVTFREEHSGFRSVFDLFKVNGIDEIRFRQMTGMKSEQKRRHRRKRMASLLKIPPARVADLSAVAESISRKSGFSGCVISDQDGLVLAQHGLDGLAENLSAVLPGMLGQICHGMSLAGLKVTGTVTISVEGQLYTVQGADNVILLAAHAENMVGESDLSYMRKIARELAWLLSVRAYAGPIA